MRVEQRRGRLKIAMIIELRRGRLKIVCINDRRTKERRIKDSLYQ